MKLSDTPPVFTSGDLVTFYRLFSELHGQHGREIQFDLGSTSGELYDALRARLEDTVDRRKSGDPWIPDQIDLAAIRILSAAVLRHCYEPEYRQGTRDGFDRVRELQGKAVAAFRTRHAKGWGSTTIWIGDCRIQFPRRLLRNADGPSGRLIAVPTVSSWAGVYKDIEGASLVRDEALRALADKQDPSLPETILEFDAESYWELEQKATERTRDLSYLAMSSGADQKS
jgi:hypothetical protein